MKIIHWVYCALLTILHGVYTFVLPSIFTSERPWGSRENIIDTGYTETFFLSRKLFAEFARRPLTTWIIELVQTTGIELKRSVVIAEYIGVFLCLVLLFWLTVRLTKSVKVAYLSVFLFATSFWFIHAFFSGIYAYDEPWQYVFLLLSFHFLIGQRLIAFSICFFVALIARESSMLLLPGIFFFLIIKGPLFSKENVIKGLKTLWVIPAYAIFLYLIINEKGLAEDSAEYMAEERFKHLYYSFANWEIAIDTISSLILAIMLPIAFLQIRKSLHLSSETDRKWVNAFWLSLFLNTVITLLFTLGRETRIFAQPVILIVPFFGLYLLSIFKPNNAKASKTIGMLFWPSQLAILVGLTLLAHFYFLEVYWPTDTRFIQGFQRFAFLTAWISICLVFVLRWRRNGMALASIPKWLLVSAAVLLLSMPFFQRGFKFFPLYKAIESKASADDIHHLIVSTNFPRIVNSYFSGTELNLVIGNFNYQDDLHTLLTEMKSVSEPLIYAELEPTVHFPATFSMSTMGNVKESGLVQDRRIFSLKPNNQQHSQPLSYSYSHQTNRFVKSEKWEADEVFYSGNGEYGPTFKVRLADIELDSLWSFGGRAVFYGEPPSDAKLVMQVNDPAGNTYWNGMKLSSFMIKGNQKNTVYIDGWLEGDWSANTSISFFVYNPQQQPIELGDIEIVLNTTYVSKSIKKNGAEDIQRLR